MTVHLVQLRHPDAGRRVAAVEENRLRLLDRYDSVYSLAQDACLERVGLSQRIREHLSKELLDYDAIYSLQSPWRILPALDHPFQDTCCLVTGTGLTHKSSAMTRQAMHVAEQGAAAVVTDSLRMFQWGLEGGRPAPGQIGTPPEWFYKGHGDILRGHGQPLDVPAFAEDGGEEGEVAGAYLIDAAGKPRRLGYCVGNEFSDHVTERKNYLYLAPSKLRVCAIGPELVVDGSFDDLTGMAKVERAGKKLWLSPLRSGEANMSHTLANLEHHHFKYPSHRRPGDVHVHFFGADAFSFGEKLKLEDGDVMHVEFAGMGRPLRNPIQVGTNQAELVQVEPL